jgi:hypothetical protein
MLLGWQNHPKRHVSYKNCFDSTSLSIALELVTPSQLREPDASIVYFRLILPYCRGMRCGSVIKMWYQDTKLSTKWSYSRYEPCWQLWNSGLTNTAWDIVQRLGTPSAANAVHFHLQRGLLMPSSRARGAWRRYVYR